MEISTLDALFKFAKQSPVVDDFFKSIVNDLAILKVIVISPPQPFVEDSAVQVFKSIATGVESIISSFNLQKMSEELAFELELHLFVLLMPVSDWMKEVGRIYEEFPKSSRFYYQRTTPLVFVDHLLENLEEMVQDTDSSTTPLNHFILRLQQELKFWKDSLIEMLEQSEQPPSLYEKHLMRRITNLAYEVEYTVDSFLIGDFAMWHSMFGLLDILKQFEQVKNKIPDDEIVVGFKEERKKLLDLLQSESESSKLQVISIVGGHGQGKTTLATQVYNDPTIVHNFNIRAVCTISQEFNERESILQLLGCLTYLSNEIIRSRTNYDLEIMLRRELLGRRFLIWLDDIWSINAWSYLKSIIPNYMNGSKILLTTRMRELGKEYQSYNYKFHDEYLNPLSSDESWMLFEDKLFYEDSCPLELWEAGREIVRNCEGLPLSIIMIAGILKKTEKTVKRWKYISANLTSFILADAKGVKLIIDLSYNYLPDYLKPCFLYLIVALGGREISASKLIRFWIAEGFIENPESGSLEDKAYNYLKDLIDRSLVKVAKMKSNGFPKSCRLDSLLHEYCSINSREDKFFQLINGYQKLFPLSNTTLDYGLHSSSSSSSSSFSKPTIYLYRRLSIFSKRNHLIMLKPSGPFAHSLLFSATTDMCPSYSYDISFLLTNFKILRILDFEDINIGDSFKIIDKLVLLRYLAVQSSMNIIPSSIDNLWNLQTFLFKGLSSEVVKVPDTFWNITKLRHVQINDGAFFDIEPHRLENSSFVSDNLQTLSTLSLTYGDDIEKLWRRMRGIQKLKCIFLDSWDDVEECNKFPLLEFLETLVSLNVIYNGEVKYPCAFSFPSKLKQLTLSNFKMPWDQIAQLADTCVNLEYLKLLNNALDGETWEMEEDVVFEKLKVLKLDNLNFETWIATSDNFPMLEHLQLQNCPNLDKIPSEFEDNAFLESIKVYWCKRSAAISAKHIEIEQHEYNNVRFKVDILPKLQDHEWSSSYE